MPPGPAEAKSARSGGLLANGALALAKLFIRPTPTLGRDLLVHCSEEMSHLATFLPALHAAEHADHR